MIESNLVNDMNMVILAIEGILFISVAVWYIWSIAQKVRAKIIGCVCL